MKDDNFLDDNEFLDRLKEMALKQLDDMKAEQTDRAQEGFKAIASYTAELYNSLAEVGFDHDAALALTITIIDRLLEMVL